MLCPGEACELRHGSQSDRSDGAKHMGCDLVQTQSNPRRGFRALRGIIVVAVAAACQESTGPAGSEDTVMRSQDGRVVVTNDTAWLSRRVQQVNSPVDIQPPVASQGHAVQAERLATQGQSVTLTLRAEIAPPQVDGATIQASHVAIQGNRAYVAYNTQGPDFRGGVEIVNTSNLNGLSILSQAVFNDTDVSALTWFGGTLFLATATNDPFFTTPAVLEEVGIPGGNLSPNTVRADLPSFVATGVAALGNDVFVTSGTGGPVEGGLSVVDRDDITSLFYAHVLADARAVELNGGGEIVVMSGTPGVLRVYDRANGSLVRTIQAGGANIPESKSTIAVKHGRIFMAAGDEGLKVFELATGNLLAQHSIGVPAGVDPADAVTNAVSIAGDLVFLANGGAGLHVLQADKDLDNDPSTGLTLTLMGQVVFPSGTSVNAVTSRGNLLFVATGQGGLKVIEIS